MSRNACNGENGETGEKSPAAGDLNWMPKVARGGWRFWRKWRFWRNWQFWQKSPCMHWRKWRNWQKITSLWRFELDAKSGPLEAGDFGENGDFGEIGNFGKNR